MLFSSLVELMHLIFNLLKSSKLRALVKSNESAQSVGQW
jgi:hypothetical protein